MESRGERGGSRAQLIIITALVLATVFVALALVLNSGIYTENLSTRETTDSEAAVGYTQEAEAAVTDAYGIANGGGASTTDEVRVAFTDVVDSWAEARSREAAKDGVSAGFEREPHLGWRLEQDSARDFTPNDGSTTDWPLAQGVENVSEFELTVEQTSLYDGEDTEGEAFQIVIDDENDDQWSLSVYQDGSDTVVDDGDSSCRQAGEELVIDLREGTVEGDNGEVSCDVLSFEDDLDSSIDISYENAENVTGEYSIVVNGSDAPDGVGSPDEQPVHFNEPDGAAPTAQAVVYSVTYSTQYERSDVRFDRDGRYAVREETYAG